MPNWCYTQVCFRGKPENIERLAKDVDKATEFLRNNRGYCNIRYFMQLNNFDTVSYRERFQNKYIPHYYDCNFRGSVYSANYDIEDVTEEGYISYYPTFEMAWYTDYQLLQIISMIYDVKFSAYSEETGCQIYDKCRNDESIDEYDFDFIISPDYEQYEEALEEGIDLDMCYVNPVKDGDADMTYILKTLTSHDIKYDIQSVEALPVPSPFGVYYHYLYGVIFDTDIEMKFCRYPETDEFNRFLIKGVTYE